MSKIKKLYIFLIFISVLICMYGVYRRFETEKVYNRYEVLMGLDDIRTLAFVQGRDYIDVAKDFQSMGVSAIIVDELTVDNISKEHSYDVSTRYIGYGLVFEGDERILDIIGEAIKNTIKDDRKIERTDAHQLILEGMPLDFKGDSIDKMGIGYDESVLGELSSNGINIVLRPNYIAKYQDGVKAIDRYFELVAKYAPNQRTVLFGSEILGDAGDVNYLQQNLDKFEMIPIFVENATQDGNYSVKRLPELIKNMNYRSVRLISTLEFIQKRYDYGIAGHHEGQEIINTYYRAITERNIRAVYFRPFMTSDDRYVSDMNIYRDRLAELSDRLERHYGIKLASAEFRVEPMNGLELSKKVKIFAIFGTIVAFLLIAEEFFGGSKKIRTVLWAASAVVLLSSAALYRERLEQLFALLAAVAFAVLSIVYLMRRTKKYACVPVCSCVYRRFFAAAAELMACIFISLGGVVFVVTLYAHSTYLLEFSKFVGVKASQVAPLIIVPLLYMSIQSADFKTTIERIAQVLRSNIKVWQMLLIGTGAGVLVIMLLRSGHSSNIEVSSTEIMLRNVLELITPARPRTKAIFLGFPALMALVMIAGNARFQRFHILLLLAATIGQANIINSFSHIRTPLIVSVYRVLGEYVVSLIIVFAFVILFDIAKRIYRRVRGNA